MSYTGASLFDLDNTLLIKNISYAFGAYLYKHGFLSTASMLRCASFYGMHSIGLLSMEALHHSIFPSLFSKCSFLKIQDLSSSFAKKHLKNMTYGPAHKKLQEAKSLRHYTAILSSSPDFLVSHAAELFGVAECVATPYVANQQGKIQLGPIFSGNSKAAYVQLLSKRLQVDLKDIFAYSDSYLDLPFLKSAGKAIGVNPDRRLRAYCSRMDWEII